MGHANDADTVFCLDAVTGKEVWKKSYPCKSPGYPGPRCSPAIDGDRVYTVSVEGHVKCWSAADGKELWSHMAGEFGGKANSWGLACSPLVLGDLLIVDFGAAVAMDKKTGAIVWKTAPYKAGYSSPKAFRSGGKDLLAIFGGDELKVLSAADGAVVATMPWKTGYDTNAAVPVTSGDEIYITTSYNHGGAKFRLEGAKLVKVWENKDLASQFATPVLAGGFLYGVSGNVKDGPIRCLDFQTGAVKWTAPGNGSLILVDGKLVILGTSGRLAVAQASPEGYKELGTTDLGGGDWWNIPVLANGLIYCRSHEGRLLCLDVRK
jgi:outer membrane protein assembly factor BamB